MLPRRTLRSTPLTAVNPAKALVKPMVCRMYSSLMKPHARGAISFFDQRTIVLIERPPGLLGGNGGELLVIVPGTLALFGLLHLEQVHRMDLASVDAHAALAHQLVVGRQLLHFGDDGASIAVTAERLDGAQVMDDRGVDA